MADFWMYLLDHDNKQRTEIDDTDANREAMLVIGLEQATLTATARGCL